MLSIVGITDIMFTRTLLDKVSVIL